MTASTHYGQFDLFTIYLHRFIIIQLNILQQYRTVFNLHTMLNKETTRSRRHEQTRERILAAAKQLLEEKGLAKFSLRGVAAASDYSPAGLYEYFSSKEELLATIARGIEGELRATLLKSESQGDHSQLVNMGLSYINFASAHPEDYLLLFTTFSSGRRSNSEQLPESSAYMVLYALVKQLVETEEIKLEDGEGIEEICYHYWVMLHGHVMMQLTHLKGYEADFEQVVLNMLNRFMKSIQ